MAAAAESVVAKLAKLMKPTKIGNRWRKVSHHNTQPQEHLKLEKRSWGHQVDRRDCGVSERWIEGLKGCVLSVH